MARARRCGEARQARSKSTGTRVVEAVEREAGRGREEDEEEERPLRATTTESPSLTRTSLDDDEPSTAVWVRPRPGPSTIQRRQVQQHAVAAGLDTPLASAATAPPAVRVRPGADGPRSHEPAARCVSRSSPLPTASRRRRPPPSRPPPPLPLSLARPAHTLTVATRPTHSYHARRRPAVARRTRSLARPVRLPRPRRRCSPRSD